MNYELEGNELIKVFADFFLQSSELLAMMELTDITSDATLDTIITVHNRSKVIA